MRGKLCMLLDCVSAHDAEHREVQVGVGTCCVINMEGGGPAQVPVTRHACMQVGTVYVGT